MRVIVLLLWVGGVLCAADPSGIWLDIPFVKQEKDGCGARSQHGLRSNPLGLRRLQRFVSD